MASANWNSEIALYYKSFKTAMKEQLELCVRGINDSELLDFTVKEEVFTYFPMNFHGDKQIAFVITDNIKEQISDQSPTGSIYKIGISCQLRLYFGDIQSTSRQADKLEIWTNLVDNYILDQIDVLTTTTYTWQNFITRETELQLAWINGGFGSQLTFDCATDIKTKG